jgi:hypothetical protein
MKGRYEWPKAPFIWCDETHVNMSIPFTWNIPEAVEHILFHDGAKFRVGGPAIMLMPEMFAGIANCEVGQDAPGLLQKVNPEATRTTLGCIRKCGFCGIGTGAIEPGGFRELPDWPNLPIICDNNLLAASPKHFESVIDRLVPHGWADFNQGIDPRILTDFHAKQFRRIKKPTIYLALDNAATKEAWMMAFERLRSVGIAKSSIRSYVLIGFKSGPSDAWDRCEFVTKAGVMAIPMWFHGLRCLKHNEVTDEQKDKYGWSDSERIAIGKWYFQHQDKGSKYCPKRSKEVEFMLIGEGR